MFTTTKKNTCSKRLAFPMALQYGLKYLPCSTEWIDVCYTYMHQQICLNSMDYGAISSTIAMRAIKTAQKSRLKHKY